MDLYAKTSYELSRHLTLRYSTSFGKSTKLFSADIQPHIFAIYGLVRIADEIVDTYEGADKATLLDELEQTTYQTIKSGYSTNPIVHAFALTAREFNITKPLIAAFFESMRLDLSPQTYIQKLYVTYIYGSAEVIGLMCLKVFTGGNEDEYKKLEKGARALGAAYQKVNFLRDIASDFHDRQRVYFPGITFESFNDDEKMAIIKDIRRDFDTAKRAVDKLPANAHKAVALSFAYYGALLDKLEKTPAETIKTSRVRVPDAKKFLLFVAPRKRKTTKRGQK